MGTSEKSASVAFVELLEKYWNTSNVPKPQILASTNVNYAKVDASRSDIVIIKIAPQGEDDRPMGNYTYRNQIIPLQAEIRTKESSQRMHDIKYELRRICFVNKHDIESFQLVSYLGFTEEVETTQNFWKGACRLEVSRVGVYALD
jgi:hypothetical protein